MLNFHLVAELLSNLVSERLSLRDHDTADSMRDEEVAKHLYDNVESILESTHCFFETEHTIDFNDNSNTEQFEDEEEEEEEINNDDVPFDEALMKVDEDQQHNLLHHFSIQYMKEAIDFYDAIHEKTGKNQHSWKSFQHRFQKVKNRKYIYRTFS